MKNHVLRTCPVGTESLDRGNKLRSYAREGVGYAWFLGALWI